MTEYSYKLPEREGFKAASEGVHQAKVFQVIDLGFQDGGKFAPGAKIGLNWLLDEGTTIFQKLNPTADKRGTFGPVVNSLMGKTHTEAELNGFDIGSLVGRGATIRVIHKTTGAGKVRAEVGTTMDAIGNGVNEIVPDDYALAYPGMPESDLAVELAKFPPFVIEMFNKRMDKAEFLKKLAAFKAANPRDKKAAAESSLA